MNILGVLFALTLAFIGNDTWTAHDRAVRAVNAEADSLRGLAIIIRQLPPQAQHGAQAALQAYAGAAVAEWSDLGRREVSAATSQAADRTSGDADRPRAGFRPAPARGEFGAGPGDAGPAKPG